MLNVYGMKVGAKQAIKGQLKPGLRKMVQPVSYWRSLEYKLVLDEGKFQKGDRVLDIGSPKLLCLYLAKSVGAEVYATDIDDYFTEEFALFREMEGISPDHLKLMVQDGRKLKFDDGFFDKVYSISTVEHIPDHGDTECVREIARVLREGGRCLITVPFSPTSKVMYENEDQIYWAEHSVKSAEGKVFFQRKYSEQDLYERLIEPSGLTLKKLQYAGEKV